jgi:hypothetical protein
LFLLDLSTLGDEGVPVILPELIEASDAHQLVIEAADCGVGDGPGVMSRPE